MFWEKKKKQHVHLGMSPLIKIETLYSLWNNYMYVCSTVNFILYSEGLLSLSLSLSLLLTLDGIPTVAVSDRYSRLGEADEFLTPCPEMTKLLS